MVQEDQAEKPWSLYVGLYTVGSKTVAMFEGFGLSAMQRLIRSEERRVGKECVP